MNIPRLVHKMDSPKPSRKTVLRRRQSGQFHKYSIISKKQDGILPGAHLEALDGQFEDVGRQLGGLLKREVAPVDDQDEAIDLEFRVFNQNLQREQDGPQDINKGVPGEEQRLIS